MGLNRTFMELKLHTCASAAVHTWFKSHLYGIEIRSRSRAKFKRYSLNRTFMELK